MAISTFRTALMHKNAASYSKLVDIKSFPALGGTPEMIDVTTLSDDMTINIPGIQSVDSLEFTANYDPEKYKELKALEGKVEDYAVWFGGTGAGANFTPTGDKGKFKWSGYLTVYVDSGDVNAPVNMNITITASTRIDTDET